MEANKEKNELSAKELESVSGGVEDRFAGLDMGQLIGGPLKATAEAAEKLEEYQRQYNIPSRDFKYDDSDPWSLFKDD